MVKSNIMGIGWKEQDNDVKIYQDIYRRLDSAEHHQLRIIRCKYLRQRGIVFVWVALTIFVLVLLVGLTLDTARVLLIVHQLQNGADAAALAGARLVKINHVDAQLQAIAIAAENFADKQSIELTFNEDNLPDGDMVIGLYNRRDQIFTPVVPGTGYINALKVVARRTDDEHGPIPLIFGPLVDVFTSNISRYAIAMPVGGDGAGLIALRPDETGLLLHGDIFLNVKSTTGNWNDGTIHINSGDTKALLTHGTSITVEASAINIDGEATINGNFETEAPINTGMGIIEDPLAGVPEPIWNPSVDNGTVDVNGGTWTLEPGYYSGGFRIGGEANVTLNPGLYILDGHGLKIVGQANFFAEGVMFFITGSGKVDIRGTGNVHATPVPMDSEDPYYYDPYYVDNPGYVDTYGGILFFQDRDNQSPAYIRGTSELLSLEGTMYFPSNHVKLVCTGDTIGAQLIAWSIEIGGDGVFNINYDGRFKTLPFRAFLVE